MTKLEKLRKNLIEECNKKSRMNEYGHSCKLYCQCVPLYEYYHDGKLHREDGPAVIYYDGSQKWYREGLLHRDDGPAKIIDMASAGISEEWYRHGLLHRDDGPAVIDPFEECWYRAGKLHREDGPAVIDYDGYNAWYHFGKLHREDGPAVHHRHFQAWYRNDVLHLVEGTEGLPTEILIKENTASIILSYRGMEYQHDFVFPDSDSAILWRLAQTSFPYRLEW